MRYARRDGRRRENAQRASLRHPEIHTYACRARRRGAPHWPQRAPPCNSSYAPLPSRSSAPFACASSRAACQPTPPQLLELFGCNGGANQNIVFNATTGRITVPQVRSGQRARRDRPTVRGHPASPLAAPARSGATASVRARGVSWGPRPILAAFSPRTTPASAAGRRYRGSAAPPLCTSRRRCRGRRAPTGRGPCTWCTRRRVRLRS